MDKLFSHHARRKPKPLETQQEVVTANIANNIGNHRYYPFFTFINLYLNIFCEDI